MTARTEITALVTGATGQQGGALTRALLERGHKVRALTRKTDSAAAKQLEKRGAEFVHGNFDDAASLERAMNSVDAVFAMSTPFERGTATETTQCRTLVDAAKKSDIKHFIYSSVASADKKTGIPHFDSKYAVETELWSSQLPCTVVAPVFFMENLLSSWMLPALGDGKLALALPARKTLQQVSLGDLAALIVLVMERRDAFSGKRIEVASEELTGEKVASVLSRVTGRKIEYVETPIAEVEKKSKDFAAMFRWLDKVGYSVDVRGLHKRYPEVGWHTFEEWAKVQDWKGIKPAGTSGTRSVGQRRRLQRHAL